MVRRVIWGVDRGSKLTHERDHFPEAEVNMSHPSQRSEGWEGHSEGERGTVQLQIGLVRIASERESNRCLPGI
jgi:hypothetical protein